MAHFQIHTGAGAVNSRATTHGHNKTVVLGRQSTKRAQFDISKDVSSFLTRYSAMKKKELHKVKYSRSKWIHCTGMHDSDTHTQRFVYELGEDIRVIHYIFHAHLSLFRFPVVFQLKDCQKSHGWGDEKS